MADFTDNALIPATAAELVCLLLEEVGIRDQRIFDHLTKTLGVVFVEDESGEPVRFRFATKKLTDGSEVTDLIVSRHTGSLIPVTTLDENGFAA
jgi:hypothetical protein